MFKKNDIHKRLSLIIFTTFCSLIFITSFSQASESIENKSISNRDVAQVAYPSYFTRPPSLGEKYNTWEGAKGDDIRAKQLNIKRLPSKVDNSERPEFPPIYKQKWGACGQFAAIASIFTYEMNVLTGKSADTLKNCYPAHFSWNMVNNAKNQGSEAYHGWEVAKRIGIPDAEVYGGVRLHSIGLWPNGYEIWRNAMENRVVGYRYTPAMTIEQLNEARGWLYDRNNPGKSSKGGILAMDGRMGELEKVTVKIPEGSYGEGADLWKKWGPTGFGHGMACVGYDDEICYDLNDDGKMTNDVDINGDGKVTLADWEKGAYIVVNSWGEKFANKGRIYLLYSAMVDPTWLRGQFLGRVEVSEYTPRKTLKLNLSCSNRSDLRVRIGIYGDGNTQKASYYYEPEHLNGWELFGKNKVGNVPLAGVDQGEPLELGVDITHLYEKLAEEKGLQNGKAHISIKLYTAKGSKTMGEIHSCSVRSYSADGKLINESPIGVSRLGQGKFAESGLLLKSVTDRSIN